MKKCIALLFMFLTISNIIIAANISPRQLTEIINVGGTSITIPIPAGFKRSPVQENVAELPILGTMRSCFLYENILEIKSHVIMTTILVSLIESVTDRTMSDNEFLDIKATSRLGVTLFREQFENFAKENLGFAGMIDEKYIFSEDENSIAEFTRTKTRIHGHDIWQYNSDIMLRIKGKLIILTYGISTNRQNPSLAKDSQDETLVWRDTILAANR